MKKFGVVLIIASMLLTGCVSTYKLTEEESDIVAAYAAYVVLKHDKKFNDTLVNIPQNTEETSSLETNNAQIEPDSNKENSESENIDSETTEMAETEETVPFATALGIEGIQIDYLDFETGNTYAEGNALAKSSNTDASLLVMHFSVTNISAEDKTLDILSLNPSFEVRINKKTTINIQPTILLSDLGTYKSTIVAGETVQAVLVSEAQAQELESVDSLELWITIGDKKTKVDL